jgi:hypothetical protein
MQLTAILLLGLFPFIGIALLVWMGPRNSWSARYRHARDHTRQIAALADRENARLAAADARLEASQRRLRGEAPDAPPPVPRQNV